MFHRLSPLLAYLFFLSASLCSSEPESVYLKTPQIGHENAIATNVGIRPFRKTGVRLECERLEGKLIVHNYGYGGSGLTLAFGGAHEVLRILEREKVPSRVVAVLGAGVVGLATAYELLEHGYEVHIYADEWIPNLTSNVAAGIWTPLFYPEDLPEEKKQLHERMLKIAEHRLQRSLGDNPEFAGVQLVTSYAFKSPDYVKTCEGQSDKKVVLVHLDNGVTKVAVRRQLIGMGGGVFLEDLQNKVKAKGAVLQTRCFNEARDLLALEESIIVNCTSMGSARLFGDEDLVPVRGELVYFAPQEGVDSVLSQGIPDDEQHFFFLCPLGGHLILGGTYEYGKDEPVIDPKVIAKIIEDAKKCLGTPATPDCG